MERALEADHGVPAGVGTRELDRVLDRLGTGVEERSLRRSRERRQPKQPLGERRVDLVRHDRVVRMAEPLQLLDRSRDDMWVRVADVETADATGEVDEDVSVDVGDRGAACFGRGQRKGDLQGSGNARGETPEHLTRARAGHLGSQLDRAGRSHRNRA